MASAERGVDCNGCAEKQDLLRQLVQALQLPVRFSAGKAVADEGLDAGVWMSRGDREDGLSYLHRVLAGVVDSLSSSVLDRMDARCSLPTEDGCDSYMPDWSSLTAGIFPT
eukprot:scaffold664267_cov60-Prasinocladus_malaysianus.AAC.1